VVKGYGYFTVYETNSIAACSPDIICRSKMRLNNRIVRPPVLTAEGAPASRITAEQQLRRLVLSCLLWESGFYSDGEMIATAIAESMKRCLPKTVAEIAVEARSTGKLRHVPLHLVRAMAALPTHRHLVAWTLEQVIQRPDELTEFLAIYWKDKKQPLSAQVKKGLARAFGKFNEYQLQKYNREGAIKLRDVLFLTHPKPKHLAQAALWKRLVDNELVTPDTWEVALSAGADKADTFMRLIQEGKLGGLALLRNLRNMQQAGVPKAFVASALMSMKTDRILRTDSLLRRVLFPSGRTLSSRPCWPLPACGSAEGTNGPAGRRLRIHGREDIGEVRSAPKRCCGRSGHSGPRDLR
jgi:60 kDa SS-A/Ro ribonucleoprotein